MSGARGVSGAGGGRGARARALAPLARQERVAGGQRGEARLHGVAVAARAQLVPRGREQPLLVEAAPAFLAAAAAPPDGSHI